MGRITLFLECCNKLRVCKAYEIEPEPGYVYALLFHLKSCPVCGHSVVMIKRYDPDYKVSEVRKTNEKAHKLFEKLKPYIFSEYNPNKNCGRSNFYLYYNEFGSVKKSYANLSSLQMGLFDPPGQNLALIPEKIML